MSEQRGDDTTGGTPPRPVVDLGFEGYEEYQEIGRGGFSVVYKAKQMAFDRTVAIKVISGSADEQTLMRFERECRTMGSMSDHPSIVTVFGNGRTEKGDLYIVMEFLSQGALSDRLAASGPLPWEEVVDVGIRIAEALQAAHDGGVLHRDVKPENIFVSKHGEAKLGDFGIARLEGSAATRSGVITASVAHAAPEILDGRKPNEGSDVYSLGSTLYTLLAGSPAFSSETDESIVPMLARIAASPVPDLRPRGVPGPVCDVLEASMSKKSDTRISSASEFAQRLRQARDQVLQSGTRPVVPILPTMPGAAPEWPDPRHASTAPPIVAPAGAWTDPAMAGQPTGQVPAGHATGPQPVGYQTGPQQPGWGGGPSATGEPPGPYAGGYDTRQVAAGYSVGSDHQPAKGGGGAKIAIAVVAVLVLLGVGGAVALTAGGSGSTTTTVNVAVSSTTMAPESSTTTESTSTSLAENVTEMNELGLGDCFNHPDLQGVIDDTATEAVLVTNGSCDEPHDMQIVGQEVVRGRRNADYPADLADRAAALCRSGFQSYVGASFDDLADVYGAITVYPDAEQWADGERNVVCAAFHRDGEKLTTSLEGGG